VRVDASVTIALAFAQPAKFSAMPQCKGSPHLIAANIFQYNAAKSNIIFAKIRVALFALMIRRQLRILLAINALTVNASGATFEIAIGARITIGLIRRTGFVAKRQIIADDHIRSSLYVRTKFVRTTNFVCQGPDHLAVVTAITHFIASCRSIVEIL